MERKANVTDAEFQV